MTVNTVDITDGPYTGNGLADEYSFSFRIEDASQIAVYETDTAGTVALLTEGSDYTVSGIGVDGGGTVTRSAGVLPTNFTWYIRSDYKYTQKTDFNSQGGFFPDVHEMAFDKLTFLVQQMLDRQNRSLKFPDSYTGSLNPELPAPGTGLYLRWDSNGNIINGSPDGSGPGGEFVPLLGTSPGSPITGALEFSGVLDSRSWEINQGNLFGVNAFILDGVGADSEVFINARDGANDVNTFRFTGSGQFFLPSGSAGNDEVWVIQGSDFLGSSNALGIYSFDTLTSQRTSNPIILYPSDTEAFAFGVDGKISVSGIVEATDPDQTVPTKIYVDEAVAAVGGLPLPAASQMLIGTDSGWVSASHIVADETTTPGQVSFGLTGELKLTNVSASSRFLRIYQDDIFGANTTVIEPSINDSAILIKNNATNDNFNFGFAGGFLSLPLEPTAPSHAVRKDYVDSKTIPTGTLNQTLTNDGSGWVPTSAITVDTDNVTIDTDLNVTGAVVSTGVLGSATLSDQNKLLIAGGFGSIATSSVDVTSLMLLSGNQNIGGTKTFTGATTAVQSLTSTGAIASGSLSDTGKILVAGSLGILETGSVEVSDLVLNSGTQNIGGAKTFLAATTTVQSLAAVGDIASGSLTSVGNIPTIGTFGILTNGIPQSTFALASHTHSGDFVTLTGNQSIGGTKTFTSAANFQSITATGNMASTTLTPSGPLYAGFAGILTTTNPSDVDLKEIFDPCDIGLAEILQLNPILHEWKDKEAYGYGKFYNFFAHEAAVVAPHLATFDENGKAVGFNNVGLIPGLVKSIHELHAMMVSSVNF